MRMTSNSQGKQNQQRSALNIPVRVQGFVEGANSLGVTGKNLLDGSQITVFLTDRGRHAQNESRPTLQECRDDIGVEVGGLMSFRECWQPKDADYHIASWPNVVAKTNNDVKTSAGHSRAAMLQLGSNNGKPVGTLFTFLDNPDNHIKGANGVEIKAAVAAAADRNRKPSFLIRIIDEQGQVSGYNLFNKFYNGQAGCRHTGAEIADMVAETVAKMQAKVNGTVNIVPADRFAVTNKGLRGKKSRFNYFVAIMKAYADQDTNMKLSNLEQQLAGERDRKPLSEYGAFWDIVKGADLCCKDTYFKVGGQGNTFANDIFPVDHFGQGKDPVLLGGLTASPNCTYVSVYEPEQNQQQGSNQQPAPQQQPQQQYAQAPQQPAPQQQPQQQYAQAPQQQGGGYEQPPIDENDPFASLDCEQFDEEEFNAPR